MTVEKIPSPCIGECSLTPETKLCQGCFRSIDEIRQWNTYSEEEKKAVNEQLSTRKASHQH